MAEPAAAVQRVAAPAATTAETAGVGSAAAWAADPWDLSTERVGGRVRFAWQSPPAFWLGPL